MEWYPVGDDAFHQALRHDHLNPNTIAVAQTYFDTQHVGSTDYRRQFLKRIVDRGQPWLQAIQFDMLPWQNNTDMLNFLEEVKKTGLEIFLQAHKNAMEELGPQGSGEETEILPRIGRLPTI